MVNCLKTAEIVFSRTVVYKISVCKSRMMHTVKVVYGYSFRIIEELQRLVLSVEELRKLVLRYSDGILVLNTHPKYD